MAWLLVVSWCPLSSPFSRIPSYKRYSPASPVVNEIWAEVMLPLQDCILKAKSVSFPWPFPPFCLLKCWPMRCIGNLPSPTRRGQHHWKYQREKELGPLMLWSCRVIPYSLLLECSKKYTLISFKLLLITWAFVLPLKFGLWNCRGKADLFYFSQLGFNWPFFNSLVQLCLLFLVALILYRFKETCGPTVGNHNHKL